MPFDTVRSDASKPATPSEKSMDTVNEPATGPAGPLNVTVGDTRSATTAYCAAAVLSLPATSWATAEATSTVTVPLEDGVIIAV